MPLAEIERNSEAAARLGATVSEFKDLLVALGTPRFQEVYGATLQQSEEIKRVAYSVAYIDGVVVALIICGIAGIGGAVLAWVLMGRRDPIKAVFDMQDEREREGYVPTGAPRKD